MPTLHHVARAAAAIVLLGASAHGQTESDLRRQVDRLATQVRDLTTQLAESQRQAERLQAERDELLARLQSADQTIAALRRGGTPPPPQPRAAVPEDPYASPASLLAELTRRYAREVASLPGANAPDRAGRVEHLRNTERWCQQAARQVRGKAVWFVRLSEPRPADSPDYVSALVTVIEEASGLPIGEPFRSEIPHRVGHRIGRENRAGRPEDAPWRATIVLGAEPTFNPERVEPGPYNIPPFIGPYAEFAFSVEWQSLTPIDAPKAPAKDGG